MTGNGLSQVFVLLISPILSRLFTPAEIGILAFLLSLVGLFTTISAARYEQAIVVAEDDSEAVNIFSLSFILSVAVSFLIFIGIIIFKASGFDFFGGNISELWAYSIPVFNLVFSLYTLFRFYAIRNKKFNHISASMPAESVAKGGLSIALGWIFGGAWGLIVAAFVAKIISLYLVFKANLQIFKRDFNLISKSRIINLAKKYYKFPAFDGPNALVHSFGQQGIVIFLAKFFSESVVGLYSYTNRILLTPVQFFANSFTQVMFQKLSVLRNKKNPYYFKLIEKSTNQIFYILIIPFAAFVYAAKYYVPFVFGENWIELYKYMYVLAPFAMLVLFSAAFNNVFKIDNKQDYALGLKLIFVPSRIAVILIGSFLAWGILKTLFVFSVVSVFTSLLSYLVYYGFLMKKPLPHSIYSFIIASALAYWLMFNYFNLSF
jgi:O-antigen/teichoic acid export membrane protein